MAQEKNIIALEKWAIFLLMSVLFTYSCYAIV